MEIFNRCAPVCGFHVWHFFVLSLSVDLE
jgi:hypothetical protein